MSEQELLPCPFCGGKPCIHQSLVPTWNIHCIECGAEAASETDVREAAIAAWNRRPTPQPAISAEQPAQEQAWEAVPVEMVVQAILVAEAENSRRGSMFPQVADEHREDAVAARRTIRTLEFLGKGAESLSGWPKNAAPPPPQLDEAKERKAFEAWARSRTKDAYYDRIPDLQGDVFRDWYCPSAWDGWLASARARIAAGVQK